MGRWMSPDWAAKAMPVPYAKLDNPQSLNLYSYVGNNPLSRIDLNGHDFWDKLANFFHGNGFHDTQAPAAESQPVATFHMTVNVRGSSSGGSNDAFQPGSLAYSVFQGSAGTWSASNRLVNYAAVGYAGAVGIGISGGTLLGATTGFSFSGGGLTTLGLEATGSASSSTAGFGTTAFGNAMHTQFGDVLLEQTGTAAEDWQFAAPNAPGVDATYFGSQNIGFNAAELKPFGYNMNAVGNQIGSFSAQPGTTSVWWYNSSGIIGNTGWTF